MVLMVVNVEFTDTTLWNHSGSKSRSSSSERCCSSDSFSDTRGAVCRHGEVIGIVGRW